MIEYTNIYRTRLDLALYCYTECAKKNPLITDHAEGARQAHEQIMSVGKIAEKAVEALREIVNEADPGLRRCARLAHETAKTALANIDEISRSYPGKM